MTFLREQLEPRSEELPSPLHIVIEVNPELIGPHIKMTRENIDDWGALNAESRFGKILPSIIEQCYEVSIPDVYANDKTGLTLGDVLESLDNNFTFRGITLPHKTSATKFVEEIKQRGDSGRSYRIGGHTWSFIYENRESGHLGSALGYATPDKFPNTGYLLIHWNGDKKVYYNEKFAREGLDMDPDSELSWADRLVAIVEIRFGKEPNIFQKLGKLLEM